jgi:hypothetical protein
LRRSMWTLKLSISKSNKRTSTPINIIYRRSVNIRSIAFVKNIRRLKCFYIFHRSLIKVKILCFSRRFGCLALKNSIFKRNKRYPARKVLSYFFSARHGEARETLQNLCIKINSFEHALLGC